jgi:hypothetical protein
MRMEMDGAPCAYIDCLQLHKVLHHKLRQHHVAAGGNIHTRCNARRNAVSHWYARCTTPSLTHARSQATPAAHLSAICISLSGLKVPSVSMYMALPSPPPWSAGSCAAHHDEVRALLVASCPTCLQQTQVIKLHIGVL